MENEYLEKYINKSVNFNYSVTISFLCRGVKEYSSRFNELVFFFSHLGLKNSFINNSKIFEKVSKTKKNKIKQSELILKLFYTNNFYSDIDLFNTKNFINLLELFLIGKSLIDFKLTEKTFTLILSYNSNIFGTSLSTKKVNSLLAEDLIYLNFSLLNNNSKHSIKFLNFFLLSYFNIYEYKAE